MEQIVFNGLSSNEYKIQIEHPPGYETPSKDYEIVHVPGRNGDVVMDKGSYQNVSRTYQIAVGSYEKKYVEMMNNISEWLHSASGYAYLWDSYEPEYYRLAMFDEALSLNNIYNQAGRTTISFNCKPQRFLVYGDDVLIYIKKDRLMNPTKFKALPIIRVKGTGSGVLSIGSYTVTISSIGGEIIINSEIQDAYSGTTNRNSDVTLASGFPKLEPGDNEISFSGGITSLEVIPKWWTL